MCNMSANVSLRSKHEPYSKVEIARLNSKTNSLTLRTEPKDLFHVAKFDFRKQEVRKMSLKKRLCYEVKVRKTSLENIHLCHIFLMVCIVFFTWSFGQALSSRVIQKNLQSLSHAAKTRSIAVPVDLESLIQSIFSHSQMVKRSTKVWLSVKGTGPRNPVVADSDRSARENYKSVIESLQVSSSLKNWG